MGQEQEDLTRTLASALWRSAFLPYCRALDNWLAAEEMVAEALRATRATRAPRPDTATAAPAGSLPSSAFPADYVRDLAHCFWQNSARSAALTLDIWLAAERHVRTLCEAALAGSAGLAQPFSAEAYWRRIRDHAEWLWLEQGRPQDRDLDTWLRAEAEVLAGAATSGNAPPVQAKPRQPGNGNGGGDGDRPRAGPRRRLALTVLPPEEAGGSAAGPWYNSVGAENSGPQPSL